MGVSTKKIKFLFLPWCDLLLITMTPEVLQPPVYLYIMTVFTLTGHFICCVDRAPLFPRNVSGLLVNFSESKTLSIKVFAVSLTGLFYLFTVIMTPL